MSEQIEAIRAEARALQQSIETATARAGEVEALAQQLVADYDTIEDTIQGMLAGARSNADRFEGELSRIISVAQGQVEQGAQAANEAAEAAHELAAQIQVSRSDLAAKQAEAAAAATALSAALDQAREAGETGINDAESALGDVVEAVTEGSQQLGQEFAEASEVVATLDTQWGEHRTEWTTAMTTQLEEIGTVLQTDVSAPMEQAGEDFRSLCDSLTSEVLTDPVHALTEAVRQEISEAMHAELEAITDEIVDLLDDFIERLTGSKDEGDVVEQALDEVIEIIEPAWNQLMDRFSTVKDIAAVVGM
jgi:chromosome segregation ATPase